MPETGPKKIVYLFGAGATHAEIQRLDPDFVERTQSGLLVSDVSRRVIEKARRNTSYLEGLETVSATSGSLNIELLISLIENSKLYGWEYKIQHLKRLVKQDIQRILARFPAARLHLHRALLELHRQDATVERETVIGLISLNYDGVLDSAYKRYFGAPNYSFSLHTSTTPSNSPPILKLHGSFNWTRTIRGRRRSIDIIPLGSAKTYLHAPYVFIWARALQVLMECDTLRVIGCSLSANDVHLIDLLFKAHLERGKPFDMEIISSAPDGEAIRRNYGFFPNIRTIEEIERHLVPEREPQNPFREWLKYKAISTLGKSRIVGTQHLKKVAM